MPYLKFLNDDDGSIAVLARFPTLYEPLLGYVEQVFWGPSPLAEKDRQIIYAYVSGLNRCDYCRGGHEAVARSYGAEAGLIDALLDDLDRAPVSDRLRALLRYVRTLTLAPHEIGAPDAEAVFSAGWDDEALHAAVTVCCLANFMNRLADGSGLIAHPEKFEDRVRNARNVGYRALFERKVAEYAASDRS